MDAISYTSAGGVNAVIRYLLISALNGHDQTNVLESNEALLGIVQRDEAGEAERLNLTQLEQAFYPMPVPFAMQPTKHAAAPTSDGASATRGIEPAGRDTKADPTMLKSALAQTHSYEDIEAQETARFDLLMAAPIAELRVLELNGELENWLFLMSTEQADCIRARRDTSDVEEEAVGQTVSLGGAVESIVQTAPVADSPDVNPLLSQIGELWSGTQGLIVGLQGLCLESDSVYSLSSAGAEAFAAAWAVSGIPEMMSDLILWARNEPPSVRMLNGWLYRLNDPLNGGVPALLTRLRTILSEDLLQPDAIDALESHRRSLVTEMEQAEAHPMIVERRESLKAEAEVERAAATSQKQPKRLAHVLRWAEEAHSGRGGLSNLQASFYGELIATYLVQEERLNAEEICALFEAARAQAPGSLERLLLGGQTISMLHDLGLRGFDQTQDGKECYVAEGEGFFSGFQRTLTEQGTTVTFSADMNVACLAGWEIGLLSGLGQAVYDEVVDLIWGIPELVKFLYSDLPALWEQPQMAFGIGKAMAMALDEKAAGLSVTDPYLFGYNAGHAVGYISAQVALMFTGIGEVAKLGKAGKYAAIIEKNVSRVVETRLARVVVNAGEGIVSVLESMNHRIKALKKLAFGRRWELELERIETEVAALKVKAETSPGDSLSCQQAALQGQLDQAEASLLGRTDTADGGPDGFERASSHSAVALSRTVGAPVRVDPALGGAIHVNYSPGGEVHLTMGPDARYVDIVAHRAVASAVRDAYSLTGRAKDLVKRVRALVAGGEHFPRGSLEWEAEFELLKLDEMVQARLSVINGSELNETFRAQLVHEVNFHQGEIDRYADIIEVAEGRAGRGFVASGNVGAAQQRLPPLPNIGLNTNDYVYFMCSSGPSGYQIRRTRGSKAPPKKLIEENGAYRVVDAKERVRPPANVKASYRAGLSAEDQKAFDDLMGVQERTPAQELKLQRLSKRGQRALDMNVDVGAKIEPLSAEGALRLEELKTRPPGSLSPEELTELRVLDGRSKTEERLATRQNDALGQGQRNKATETLGHQAATEYMLRAHKEGVLVHEGRGSGTFDQVWKVNDQYVIVEAKGGSGTNAVTREVKKLHVQQGHGDYAKSVAEAMLKSAGKSGDKKQIAFASDVFNAIEKKKVIYLEVTQKLNNDNTLGRIQAREYDLTIGDVL